MVPPDGNIGVYRELEKAFNAIKQTLSKDLVKLA